MVGLYDALNRRAPIWWIGGWALVVGTLGFILGWSDLRTSVIGWIAMGTTGALDHQAKIRAFIRRRRG